MLRAYANRLAVVIPAHRPSVSLLDFISALTAKSLPHIALPHIVVVDDGSGPDFRDLFARAAELPGVVILHHATNLGRGAAIRTGLNYSLCTFPALLGAIVADPDSHPDDVECVAESMLAHPESLIVTHADDTETALRGIPAIFAPRVLQLEASGPEFEYEMRSAALHAGVPVVQERIAGAGTATPQFNPFKQSTRLAFLLPRAAVVSLIAALIDNLVFVQALRHGRSVLVSLGLARIAAMVFHYPVVRSIVFRSRPHHGSLLPKYLLLVLGCGAASFAGIGLLGATMGIAVLPAKLLTETSLFLINFAVQRLWLFTDLESSNTPAFGFRIPPGRLAAMVGAVFTAALLVEAHGFRTTDLFSQDIWEPIGVARFLKYLGMFLGIAFPLLLMAPWTFAGAITALTAVGTAIAVGPLALLAVVFYLISCCALGSRLLGRRHSDSPESQLFSTLLGVAVWIFAMTLMARLPVNYPAVWVVLLAVPVLLDGRGAWRRLVRWWELLRGAELRGYAERVAFAAVVFVLLAQWFVALKPEGSADGLAMHLAIPANIAVNHAMTYEPSRVLWAVMPMGADFSYAIVYQLGGEYAAHLLDFTLLLLIEAVLYFAMRRWVCRAAAFWLLALFASTPMVQLVTGSLFIENMLAVMIVGMAAALWRFADTGEKRFFYLTAALGGTAMATKFGALAFVAMTVPFLALEAARHWRSLGPRPASACGLAALLLVSLGAPPYAIAYIKTGNPLFPFLYEKIPTPLIPRDAGLVDERFKRPLTWDTPYDLTFRTNLTYEGRNGSFGFQYLVLAPLGVVALLVAYRRRNAVSAAVIALGAAAIVMGTQPNARYIYAALPLLSVPFAALLGWAAGTPRLYRALLAFVAVCMALNVRFLPSASYYHRDFCLRLPFSRAEHDRYRAYAAPVREVIDHFNSLHASSAVMMTAESAIAGLQGDIYENHWQQIRTYFRIRETKTVPDMMHLMQTWHVEYFISPKLVKVNAVEPAVFQEMLARCTQPIFEQGGEYLARLEPACRPGVALLVHRGTYDDFDPALLYSGDWYHDRTFAEPDQGTVSYTDIPGAAVEIDFEGKALTYVYTMAANRGIASITVDGVEQAPMDLYSADTLWRSQKRFCCFSPGRHVATIRVTGKANPQAKGKFVDLDSFTVE